MSKDQSMVGDGTALDFNPYLYCNNSPIDRIDPDGKAWWNKVVEYASNVVKAVCDTYVRVNNAIQNFIVDTVGSTMAAGLDSLSRSNNRAVRWLTNKTNAVADWTDGNVGKALIAGIAISAAVVGGAAAVGVAITYVAGLGTYGATVGAGEAGGAGGTIYRLYGEKPEHVIKNHVFESAGTGSKFPVGWGVSQIVKASEFVANNQSIQMLPNTYNRPGFIRVGEYGGTIIKTVVQYDAIEGINRIWTAFPFK